MTRLVEGMKNWTTWLNGRYGHAHLLIDAEVAELAFADEVRAALSHPGITLHEHRRPSNANLDDIVTLSQEIAATDAGHRALLVAVGGGGVLDQGKLVRLLLSDSRVERRLATTQRCGFIALPAEVLAHDILALVPTTLGTGAESSRSACVQLDGTKRLAHGGSLRADLAVVTPAATRSLPQELIVEGILETLLRLFSPYVGSHSDRRAQDDMVERYAAQLIRVGDTVQRLREAGQQVPDELLAEIAMLSSVSHSDDLLTRRDPYCDVCWPLANELSMVTAARKLPALAALTPVIWRRALDGDARLGSAGRLRRLWTTVASNAWSASPDSEPDIALASLIQRWGISPLPQSAESMPDAAAKRAARTWGNGLPMLKGLSVSELSALYADVLTPTQVPVRI